MCQGILHYDCGHLQRITLPCSKPRKRRSSFQRCFTGAWDSSDAECEGNTTPKKVERRAHLCDTCESQGRQREIYQNIPPSPPNKGGNTPVSAKKPNSSEDSRQQRPLPPALRRVREADSSLRGEYTRLDPPRVGGFGAGHDRATRRRPSNIDTSRQASGQEAGSSSTGNSQTAVKTPRSNGRESPWRGRCDSAMRKLSQDIKSGLQLRRKDSDESFVCSKARSIEKKSG